MSMQMIAVTVAMAMAMAPLAIASGHPVEKVINLLKKLSDQAVDEGKVEEVSFSKFRYWCTTSISKMDEAIEEEKTTIDELGSNLEGFKQEKKELEPQIKDLVTEINNLQTAAKNANDADLKRNQLYKDATKDLKATIKSVEDCIAALTTASKTDSKLFEVRARTSVHDVLALLSEKVEARQRNVLGEFAMEVGAPSPAKPAQLAKGDSMKHVKKYKFKSGGVLELLKGLKVKFEDDLHATEIGESNAAASYRLEKNARAAAEKAAVKSKDQKNKMLADTKTSLADAEANLKDEKADLKADSDTLSKTKTTCSTKAREWEERSETRKNELEAMKAAIEILAEVSGVRTNAPNNPTLPAAPVFLEILDPKAKAIQLLRETALTTHSKALERLAVWSDAQLTGLPMASFKKVSDTMQKMIYRLKAEQADEDKHKAWCDTELDKSTKSKTDKEQTLKDLTVKITADNANIAKLTIEIQKADKMIADITASRKEATTIRNEGKKENMIAIKESKQAQKAIANAVAVLETHYKKSGEIAKKPWEFIQEEAPVKLPKDPKLWGSSYTGVADPKKAGTGVIAILEKIASDFSRMEAETKAQEVQDQKKFQDMMASTAEEMKRRKQESEMKLQEKKRKQEKVNSMVSQKAHTAEEIVAVTQYLDDLKPACVKGDSTYADRKSARTKEIKALKDAKVILRDAFKKTSLSFLSIRPH